MLMPKRVKHRKVMRGRMSGMAKGGHSVAFGDFGLATLEPAWITSRQIEAARRAMTRSVKRGGKIWIRIFGSLTSLGTVRCRRDEQLFVSQENSVVGHYARVTSQRSSNCRAKPRRSRWRRRFTEQ